MCKKIETEKINYWFRIGFIHGLCGHEPFPPLGHRNNREYLYGYESGIETRKLKGDP